MLKALDKIGKGILIMVLTASVLVGGYLGYTRYFIELQDRTVELCVDLNDIKKIAAYEKKPLGPILDEIRKKGITSIGLFEETLPDASALGEIYYAKGAGILRLKNLNPIFQSLVQRGLIKPGRTYIYAPSKQIRKRVFNQLRWVLQEKDIGFLGPHVIEVNESEEEIRELGLGISEAQRNFLIKKGFSIIPRVWNDPRYHLGNINLKISALKKYDTIIFDGEEILGYPDSLKAAAQSLKMYKVRYGYIEIVKQDGDKLLRKLMQREVVRVHSVPKEELKKLHKDEVIKRFVRAARERKVRLIYVRPFLPPQIDAYPVAYNLKFFGQVKKALEKDGFVIGKALRAPPLKLKGWHILSLGLGVIIGGVFLLNQFFNINIFLMYPLVLLSAGGLTLAGINGYDTEIQKTLALLTTIIFPALAITSSFSRNSKPIFLPLDGTLIILNVLAESFIGVFILIGLLADHRFMLGVETFRGVKLSLIFPIMLVALYFILKQGSGGIRERIKYFLNTRVKMTAIMFGVLVLGGLGVYLARSGNFALPVPVFEKHFRNLLEAFFFIRPRTKEFIIGYPFIFLAAAFFLRGKTNWLWVLAALGTIAPVSILNTFSHIHTPLTISMVRTVNGLVLGVVIGIFISAVADSFLKKKKPIDPSTRPDLRRDSLGTQGREE